MAEAYLNYLYSDAGQKLAAKHFYRPAEAAKVDAAELKRFPELKLATIEDFGGWKEAQDARQSLVGGYCVSSTERVEPAYNAVFRISI